MKRRLTKSQFKEMEPSRFTRFIKDELMPTPRKPGSGIAVIFPYDLRSSLDDKCNNTVLRWVAYVNNAGTLCHVVSPEAEILIRLSFKKYPIKNLPINYMRIAIIARIEGWVKL